jgi:hypothetical protein
VTSTGAHTSPDACLDALGALFIIEKGHMLFPWQTYHHPQTVALCRIKKPARRYGIRADGVQAVIRHLGKVILDGLGIMILVAIRIGMKRPICNTSNPEFFVPNEKKFPLNFRTI